MVVKIYLESSVMPVIGEPAISGISINLGNTEKEFDYDELVAGLNLDAIADTLDVPRGSLTIITPEEYAAKYGED